MVKVKCPSYLQWNNLFSFYDFNMFNPVESKPQTEYKYIIVLTHDTYKG